MLSNQKVKDQSVYCGAAGGEHNGCCVAYLPAEGPTRTTLLPLSLILSSSPSPPLLLLQLSLLQTFKKRRRKKPLLECLHSSYHPQCLHFHDQRHQHISLLWAPIQIPVTLINSHALSSVSYADAFDAGVHSYFSSQHHPLALTHPSPQHMKFVFD